MRMQPPCHWAEPAGGGAVAGAAFAIGGFSVPTPRSAEVHCPRAWRNPLLEFSFLFTGLHGLQLPVFEDVAGCAILSGYIHLAAAVQNSVDGTSRRKLKVHIPLNLYITVLEVWYHMHVRGPVGLIPARYVSRLSEIFLLHL